MFNTLLAAISTHSRGLLMGGIIGATLLTAAVAPAIITPTAPPPAGVTIQQSRVSFGCGGTVKIQGTPAPPAAGCIFSYDSRSDISNSDFSNGDAHIRVNDAHYCIRPANPTTGLPAVKIFGDRSHPLVGSRPDDCSPPVAPSPTP